MEIHKKFKHCNVKTLCDLLKELHKNWTFQATGDTLWSEAQVPGTVHTDLLDLHKIEDPFYRLNEHDLQWIDKKDWVYQSQFPITEEVLEEPHIALLFDGIDTYGKVFLNFK